MLVINHLAQGAGVSENSDFENTIIVIIHHINAFIISHWNLNVTKKNKKNAVNLSQM